MQVITSKDNERIKKIRKLKDSKKEREEQEQFIVEGTKMIEEAIKEEAKINTIIICEECIKQDIIDSKLLYEIAKYECLYVSENIFKALTDVVNPQGIIAIIDKDEKIRSINYEDKLIVLLDGVQDPGNLGTILRTLDAAGIKQVIVTNNTVEVYNPKVIRATMGAIFRIKVIKMENINELKKHGYKMVSTTLNAETNIYDIKFNKHVVVIGNEANGVSADILEKSDIKAKIPMPGNAESLNASVAASIIIYEFVRQNL